MTEPPVRLVLDTSAILAFAAGSLHVGETITQVEENGTRFGLPIACLAAAHVADAQMVQVLIAHQTAELVAVDVDAWRAWAAMTDTLGRLDTAAALLAASDFNCDVLTSEPELYRALGDDPPIVGV